MDREKKPLHHNESGREHGGGVRGLSGLPWVAAKVLQGYFSSLGVSLRKMGSKPRAGPPSLQHQIWKGTQKTSSCEKQQGFCPRERWLETRRASYRAKAQNFVCSHIPWAPAEGEQSGLETLEKSLRLVALGRELKEQLPRSLRCHSPLQKPSLSGRALLSCRH